MRKIIFFLFVAILATIHAIPAYGWGQKGHRIIAKIAYDNLSKKARKAVDNTLGQKGAIYWANWPDEIKSDTIYPNSHDWHFQDFDGGMSDSLVADALIHYPKEGGNLFRALDSLMAILRQETAKKKASADMTHVLRFIVHLSGDRYCPMHMAHMDDKGGNLVKMKWFGENTRLHTVWDTHLIESQGYSYTEYTEKLEIEYGWLKNLILQQTDAELLLDTYHLTSDIYNYQTTWDGNTYHYIYRWRTEMEEQLFIAGIRLAQILNDIYK